MSKYGKYLILTVLLAVLAVTMSCIGSNDTTGTNTSFDKAHLMMITARDILGEYSEVQIASVPGVDGGVVPATWRPDWMGQSTLEQLNQQMALAKEYENLAKKALASGNEVVANILYLKAENCYENAAALEEKRVEWRRNRRFNSVIRRGVKNLGQAVGNTLNFVGTAAGQYVEAQVEGYAENIRTFLHNPLRYAFDIKMGHQLDIVKHQFTDRLGPFFGERVYELIGMDEAAWQAEGQIFNKPTRRPSKTPSKTREVDFSEFAGTYSGKLDPIGDWEGSVQANEITLEIEKDGTVNGEILFKTEIPNDGFQWGAEHLNGLHFCESKNVVEVSGKIHGRLTNRTGTLEVEIDFISSSLLVSDCPPTSEDVSIPYESSSAAEVRIQEEKITGTIPGIFDFELHKE